MTTEYQLDDDDKVPFNVNDDEIEIPTDEAHGQEKGDVLPAGKGVLFSIKKALIRRQLADNKKPEGEYNPCTVTRVVLHCQVGPDGVDSTHAGAGRLVFPEFVVAFNIEALKEQARKNGYELNEESWRKEKRYPWIELMAALRQFDPKDQASKPPKINEAFLTWLYESNEKRGQRFIADILRKAVRVKNGNEWVDSGDFKNELKNFKAVPPAPVDDSLL